MDEVFPDLGETNLGIIILPFVSSGWAGDDDDSSDLIVEVEVLGLVEVRRLLGEMTDVRFKTTNVKMTQE